MRLADTVGVVSALVLVPVALVLASVCYCAPPPPPFPAPKPPANAMEYSVFRTAPISVAMVFGRATGCARCMDASFDLVSEVADQATAHGVDPRIAAALIAVESGCDSFAVSNRGAIGLAQVMPRIWNGRFDFTKTNLFNRHENLRVGMTILGESIFQYGVVDGLHRYNGLGAGGDAQYVEKILKLAGRK